jgi:hypothetical protein
MRVPFVPLFAVAIGQRDPLVCPDNATQFVAFCPNDNQLEQGVTREVYQFAVDASLNSVLLLLDNATRANFLNYSSCPNLVGLFYDGDANRESITAYDGFIDYTDIGRLDWNYSVTSYWLACQAFNPPMLDAMTRVRPRRWAAGRNDLLIGTSDNAAARAMIAAINGSCLAESFDRAVKKLDRTGDVWGYGGFGPNIFRGDNVLLPCGGLE